ncbi:hypothetical protein MEU_02389 [Candida albicans P37005]|nr:hypothetical protein MEU_02389 [Candida albicans P37005]KGT70372.1 hypothetical protein MEK_02398 [Candida albicans 12C]
MCMCSVYVLTLSVEVGLGNFSPILEKKKRKYNPPEILLHIPKIFLACVVDLSQSTSWSCRRRKRFRYRSQKNGFKSNKWYIIYHRIVPPYKSLYNIDLSIMIMITL